jgi:hypothetical protein
MDHYAKTAESLKDFHGLLEATGLFGAQARVANSKRGEYVTQDEVPPPRIHALRQELERKVNQEIKSKFSHKAEERKARTNRLILVSKATLTAVVQEVCPRPLFENIVDDFLIGSCVSRSTPVGRVEGTHSRDCNSFAPDDESTL